MPSVAKAMIELKKLGLVTQEPYSGVELTEEGQRAAAMILNRHILLKGFLIKLGVSEKACVDPKRIYAAGFSMGGGFSNYAGCFLSEYFAAAAPSAFDLSEEIVNAGKCSPARAFPILNFRGTNDFVVNYDGGYSSIVSGKPITFLGAQKNFEKWAELNGCSEEPVDKGNGCKYYENCRDGVQVGLCTIQGGGHSEGDGKTAWDFVKQFRLP